MRTTLPRMFVMMGIAGVIGLALPVNKRAAASTGQTSEITTTVVAKLTGADSLNRTDRWNVYGTDLGHMFQYEDNGQLQLRFAFGDTFGPAGTDHRDNTMAWSTDKDVTDGVKFDSYVTDRPRHAKKLFDDPNVSNVIPTNGIAVGKLMFLHYMAVRRWGDPGHWDVAYSGLAYSDDKGKTWTMDRNVKWGEDSNFAQVAFLRHNGYIYLFGIPEGRFGGVKKTGVQVARVPEGKLLEPGAYHYWNGKDAIWELNEEKASTIVPWPVGELSVRWNDHYGKWFMTYLNDDDEEGELERIVLRYAEKDSTVPGEPGFIGPWTGELTLTTSAEYSDPYAPYQVPDQPVGRDLYYTMSRFWPVYNVFLMKTRLPDPLP